MKLEKLNEIIDLALEDVLHGQLVNASGLQGKALETRLSGSLDMLIELDTAVRKVAGQKGLS